MSAKHPQSRSVTKSRKSSSATRRAGQSAARSAGRGPSYNAKPLPKAAAPALLVVSALMLIPVGWGVGVLLGFFGGDDPLSQQRNQGTAIAMMAAGGSLAVVCLAMAWWVRKQHGAKTDG
ncbi:MAG: hypothetical protein AAGF84_10185 [Planctomycetota bacterium]